MDLVFFKFFIAMATAILSNPWQHLDTELAFLLTASIVNASYALQYDQTELIMKLNSQIRSNNMYKILTLGKFHNSS